MKQFQNSTNSIDRKKPFAGTVGDSSSAINYNRIKYFMYVFLPKASNQESDANCKTNIRVVFFTFPEASRNHTIVCCLN